MKKRGHPSAGSKRTKTDQIAGMFTKSPLDTISPKEISKELGLDIKLVTAIVNRLRNEGMVERVGWGRYQFSIKNNVEEGHLSEIMEDMTKMTLKILGPTTIPLGVVKKDPSFRDLVALYTAIRDLGGDMMAQNVLRLSAAKNLPEDRVTPLIETVMEVSSE